MNRTLPKIGLALLLLTAAPAVAKRPAVPAAQPAAEESLDSKIARIRQRIGELTRELNYLVWECYLQYADEREIAPEVTKIQPSSTLSQLDSIPGIAALHQAMRAADADYTAVLRTDPEYEAIHREYVAIKNLDDNERRNRNKEQYNRMYDRLRTNNPDYEPAFRRMRRAKQQYNTALLRTLVDYHREHGYALPTTLLFRNYSDTMTALRGRCQRIAMLETELSAANQLHRQLLDRRMAEEFDPSVPECETPAPDTKR